MTEKTFEELFPELKDLKRNLICDHKHIHCVGGYSRDYVVTPDIEEHCLSKQRVKEAISRQRLSRCSGDCDRGFGAETCCDDISSQALLEDLGLN